ncbi:hypothetical protein ACQB60_20895 [Actinomycetota bacterium Odt1-20B]
MKRAALSLAAATFGATVLFAGATTPVQAAPAWDKSVKCQREDPDNRVIPTRVGNGALGWRHFSGPHNIKKCSVVNTALKNSPVAKDGARLTYEGFVVGEGRHIKVIAIVQYARRTSDRQYDAGAGQRIGVITAYCDGMNRCPNWVNQ